MQRSVLASLGCACATILSRLAEGHDHAHRDDGFGRHWGLHWRAARGSRSGVSFIARGAHLQAMREKGLTVASPLGDVILPKVNASESAEEIGPVDVVVFAVKTYDSENAAASLGPLLKRSTRVVTLQNGIESVEMLGRHVIKLSA